MKLKTGLAFGAVVGAVVLKRKLARPESGGGTRQLSGKAEKVQAVSRLTRERLSDFSRSPLMHRVREALAKAVDSAIPGWWPNSIRQKIIGTTAPPPS